MATPLAGKTVAILAADGVEQVEYEEPKDAVEEAGAETVLVSLATGQIQSMDSDIHEAGKLTVDRAVADVSFADFDALILPGGAVNPDNLRADGAAVAFVRDFYASGKPIGAICHAPWTLVEAGVLSGVRVASYPSIRTDLKNAGAIVVDEEVVTDRGLVTSRSPEDLPAFCAKIVEEFAEGPHER